MMDSIFLKEIAAFPPVEGASEKGYIKHVFCNGARFHVVSWSSLGMHCSEPKCILNKKKVAVK